MELSAPVTIDVGRGLVLPARQVPSPNQDPRPPGGSVDLVVIHGISLPPGDFGGDGVERLFMNQLPADGHPFYATIAGLRVSAHLYLRRGGDIVQFVPFHARAWHAGVSSWRHRPACNDYSIGIELEGTDEVPYASAQYLRLAEVLVALERAYPTLAPDALVGHSDIAPGRKTDPGPAFDWAQLRARLAAVRAAHTSGAVA